jgi:hypothetical protein
MIVIFFLHVIGLSIRKQFTKQSREVAIIQNSVGKPLELEEQ